MESIRIGILGSSMFCVFFVFILFFKDSQSDFSGSLNTLENHNLMVPSHLQDISFVNQTSKIRKRRFLVPNTLFEVKLNLIVPGELVFGLPLDLVRLKSIFAFIVPANFVLQLDGLENFSFIHKRNIDSNRTLLYDKIQTLLSGWGMDGHACFLRTLCEISEIPFKQGILGEIVNFFFRVDEATDHLISNSIEEPEIYDKARIHGKMHGSCGNAYPRCPVSLLKGLSKIGY